MRQIRRNLIQPAAIISSSSLRPKKTDSQRPPYSPRFKRIHHHRLRKISSDPTRRAPRAFLHPPPRSAPHKDRNSGPGEGERDDGVGLRRLPGEFVVPGDEGPGFGGEGEERVGFGDGEVARGGEEWRRGGVEELHRALGAVEEDVRKTDFVPDVDARCRAEDILRGPDVVLRRKREALSPTGFAGLLAHVQRKHVAESLMRCDANVTLQTCVSPCLAKEDWERLTRSVSCHGPGAKNAAVSFRWRRRCGSRKFRIVTIGTSKCCERTLCDVSLAVVARGRKNSQT